MEKAQDFLKFYAKSQRFLKVLCKNLKNLLKIMQKSLKFLKILCKNLTIFLNFLKNSKFLTKTRKICRKVSYFN